MADADKVMNPQQCGSDLADIRILEPRLIRAQSGFEPQNTFDWQIILALSLYSLVSM